MLNDPSRSDATFIYLIGIFVGCFGGMIVLYIVERSPQADRRRREAMQLPALIAGAAGGLLGVMLFGPWTQIVWRNAADWLAATSTSADHGWPYPVSLWYSAGFFGSFFGGLGFALLATMIARIGDKRSKS